MDLTKANIETFSRFATSREVTELAKDSATKHLELVQNNMAKIAASNAFAACNRRWVPSVFRRPKTLLRYRPGQEFVTRQVEEGDKRFAQDCQHFRRWPLKRLKWVQWKVRKP